MLHLRFITIETLVSLPKPEKGPEKEQAESFLQALGAAVTPKKWATIDFAIFSPEEPFQSVARLAMAVMRGEHDHVFSGAMASGEKAATVSEIITMYKP